MKVRVVSFLVLLFPLVQNCGDPFEANVSQSLYPYEERPDFYHDVKLVEIRERDQLTRYEFDIAMSYASDPEVPVEYLVQFSTLIISAVCMNESGTAEGNSKSFRVSCSLPIPEDLYIMLRMRGPQEEEVAHEYHFPID